MTNPVIDCLTDHRSVRKFKPDPIDTETLETILNAGTRGATGGNLQLYSLIIIDDEEKKNELGVGHAPLVIAGLVDLHRISRWLEINVPEGTRIYNDNAWHFFNGFCDTIIALQNIVIASESLGLGTCYYGAIVSVDVQEFFNAPEYVFPAGMVAIGYPDESPDLSVRLPLEAVVHTDTYPEFSDDEIRSLYRERGEAVWDGLPDELRQTLKEKGIHNIPQGIARRKFSKESFEELSGATVEILKKSKFVVS